jgi:Family of unknown function (DUF5989)
MANEEEKSEKGGSKDEEKPAQGGSKFEQIAKTEKSSLVGDTIGFLKNNKKWWLLPIISTLLLISVLLLLSGTAIAPFIYTLF